MIRTKKNKVVVFEEPDETVEAEDEDQGDNDGNDSVDEPVGNPENQEAIEKDEAGGTSERREVSANEKDKTDNVEKEENQEEERKTSIF
jgi:hypothetical protein